ncbi:diguanylate cyclase (GGDEF)-like protein [Luteibacter rhizovicinus]|uniref:diguanylate cyclase n=1 Tax=Luteibacter rhizovicinus TaxID=242606 RepID=A0A4R3YSY2_9GAMM|nr:GGDEF domain-containing protein [Luteibacter rhizovicinus]TCV94828.1 diguanylate cyclase (GGDEF)-like protein [Luteibacter rhizovicinus]
MLLGLLVGNAGAVASTADNPASQLTHADSIKTSDHVAFVEIIDRLERNPATLSPSQQWHLRYLIAWQDAYGGDYEGATTQLNAIAERSPDAVLRFRARATLVNILGIGHRYEEAFSRLSQLVELLPQITDKTARYQGLGEAAQVLIAAGQYDLAITYAEQMLDDIPPGENTCKAMSFKLHALLRSGRLSSLDSRFKNGIDACVEAHESVFANALRADVARFYIANDRTKEAIDLLQSNYPDVLRDQYPSLTSKYNALLAQAYFKEGDTNTARGYALDAVDGAIKDEFTEPLSIAYEVLYLIEKQRGDLHAALAYHEQFLTADKGYLNDISARSIAYQIVQQQVLAKKLQVEGLNKQNQILQLQQALDRKAVETSRLYIALLLTALASIALILYRLKRSELRFMRLARRDGLTGICNRQHFVDEGEQVLRYAAKSSRGVSMILLDLDHFKNVNDTHGHAAGDQVLKRTVMVCRKYLHSTDVFGRLGGEEFGIMLPECTPEQAMERADRIRVALATTVAENSTDVPVTASFGVASTDRCGYELSRLLVEADDALYQAKRDGRNRVVYGKVNGESDSPYPNATNEQVAGSVSSR